MSKYLELFKNAFDDSIDAKTKPENKPYIGYSIEERKVVYTVIPNYLCLEPLEENNQLAVLKIGLGNTQYSFDKETWNEFPVDSSNPLNPVFVTVDRPVYLKGNNPNGYLNFEVGGCKIVGSGKYNVSGDATTLLNEKGNVKDLTPYGERCLASLFGYLDVSDILGDNTLLPYVDIVDASELILPSTILTPYCYNMMFAVNLTLEKTPIVLPATKLAPYCYEYMFGSCENLTTAPELPATTLAERCYRRMFIECKSLTTAPELPATILAPYCYEDMFKECGNLTKAPSILPSATLAERCYASMFYQTNLTTAPELPATKLAPYCYYSMFESCYSLTTTPELPATELAEGCYSWMFAHCTNLTQAPELSATTLADYCYSSMFEGCGRLTTAPELPAMKLAKGCYCSMFNICGSLTTAPELPATTLVDNCYFSMFSNCGKLNYIKCLATDISAESCTTQWVWANEVSSTGTFVKHPDMNDWTTGTSGIPSGWEVKDANI